jgi:transcription-repair coupling factor (superfamily II helicase)
MKDLEIRGAGNILGSEQSGHIHAVGFELYTKLLAAAVEDLRSQESLDENDPKILVTQPQKVSVDLGIPAGIPQEYINDLTIRLSIYQKLTTIKNRDQCDDIEQELKDRFGPFPWQVANLIYVMRLKIISGLTGIEFIAKKNDKITIQFPYDLTQIKDALSKSIGQSWVIGNKQIRNNKNEDTINWQEELLSTIENIAGFQIEMSEKLKETNQL